jgi:hypothetical protein
MDLGDAQIVIIGCGERRGHNGQSAISTAPDAIRKQLYPWCFASSKSRVRS